MAQMIKGIKVKLHTTVQTGVDSFGFPVETQTIVEIDNVLVGEPTTDDIATSKSLYGKKCVYTLAIPKGDTHDWSDVKVEFFGKTFQTFGDVIQAIESNVPLYWNKKVKVELYE